MTGGVGLWVGLWVGTMGGDYGWGLWVGIMGGELWWGLWVGNYGGVYGWSLSVCLALISNNTYSDKYVLKKKSVLSLSGAVLIHSHISSS